MAAGSIFICYRREDSIAYAGRLYDRLSSHFGKNRVFMDIDTIQPGEDFIEILEQRVGACDALIAVIGKQWADSRDEDGRRRLDDPEDYVRREIAAALERKVRVIPALVGGARMPRSSDMPPPIGPLARRNAIEISDSAFHVNVEKLIATLEEVIKAERLRKDAEERQAQAAIRLNSRPTPPADATSPGQPRSAQPIPDPAESLTAVVDEQTAASTLARPRQRLVVGAAILLGVGLVVLMYLQTRDRSAHQTVSPAAEQTSSAPAVPPVPTSITHTVSVRDDATGLPIRNAAVSIEDGEIRRLTLDAQGGSRFERASTAPALATISVRAPGYIDASASVDLNAQTHHVFRLRGERPPPAQGEPSLPKPAVRQATPPRPASGPVRIGGNIKEPRKTKDVPPVYPPIAQSARVQGVVIVEVTIGPTGQVQDARVLRSIPLLDQAALDAVRQWEFTQTLLNGVPVSVIMTVTVKFTLVVA